MLLSDNVWLVILQRGGRKSQRLCFLHWVILTAGVWSLIISSNSFASILVPSETTCWRFSPHDFTIWVLSPESDLVVKLDCLDDKKWVAVSLLPFGTWKINETFIITGNQIRFLKTCLIFHAAKSESMRRFMLEFTRYSICYVVNVNRKNAGTRVHFQDVITITFNLDTA